MTPVFFRKKKKEEAIHVSDYDTESRQVESRPDGKERKKKKDDWCCASPLLVGFNSPIFFSHSPTILT